MLLPRLQPPLRAALTSIARSAGSGYQAGCLNEGFAQLAIKSRTGTVGNALGFVRYASHKTQGAVNKAKDGPGKRLGAKKSGEQYVIPGNIIFRQRGTHWFPGDNCGMGRDHTIYATEAGYVKYYKDPEKHPKRQYIGVVFERDQVLPLPRNSMRRRKLNMVAEKMEVEPVIEPDFQPGPEDGRELLMSADGEVGTVMREAKLREKVQLRIGKQYMYRESNWEIGRAAERAGVKVKEFKPRDRWEAWRKRNVRKAAAAEKRALGGRKSKK